MVFGLHIEHPIGDFAIFFRGTVGVAIAQLCLVHLPVAVVAAAGEGHRWGSKLFVLVEGESLTEIRGPAVVNVLVDGTRRDFVAHCPREAHTLWTPPVLHGFSIGVTHLRKVGLEGAAERVETLGVARHVLCSRILT